MKMQILSMIVFLTVAAGLQAQQPVQVLRGNIFDQALQQPISNATATIVELDKSVVSDNNGYFRFNGLPLGTYTLMVTHAAYELFKTEGVIINAGKETVLQVPLTTKVKEETAVVVKAGSRRNLPNNTMSLVSARAFSVEETQKYAAAVNDPLRMAMAFPGVMAVDDGNNQIIIRGNSPSGMLWRMEGMDIPNPNHFGNAGASGGGISILSSQLLSNSDFVTGAFAAEYGNALSGVFDLKLRKGNNEKREYAVQAGILGLNVAAEGPFAKKLQRVLSRQLPLFDTEPVE
ncbi:MAG: carboxypeptidase-like regulatory domain-containing protein [Chitinophagaceae bacterium]|nr:carboxypeptidase-like regulatory domain-containing protein [Chitinophagaceae bacterium]